MDKNRTYTSTIYDEHRKEKAERRGTGFVGFLSDLDWMLSLELEEGRTIMQTLNGFLSILCLCFFPLLLCGL